MASLPFFSGAATAAAGRVVVARATKGSAGSTEEPSLIDWVLGNLTKQDQFYETDPLLLKVEGSPPPSGRGTTGVRGTSGTIGKKNTAVMPENKNGAFGLGGLYPKK